jgi:hypothetical protein
VILRGPDHALLAVQREKAEGIGRFQPGKDALRELHAGMVHGTDAARQVAARVARRSFHEYD